ncbi:hypothetical protein CAPTEDRAFT_171215 [Capitella teleta]|uniref:Oxidoreductase-like domain-containing protein n=1 Tax=Capitella teleta TaxID=283909 RepID=R7VG83_CAPTE|nr:hypothetical protein CAPTEDRAFT_171215 [Capitella teleta]|eukprot:ELU15311.1 hypothetical protein CAPTEDRAFT_171215 [Capitella teleta]
MLRCGIKKGCSVIPAVVQCLTRSASNHSRKHEYKEPRYVLKDQPPDPPLHCCESGCANCVWIQYTEELIDYYHSEEEAKKKVLSLITDPQFKAFIQMELAML